MRRALPHDLPHAGFLFADRHLLDAACFFGLDLGLETAAVIAIGSGAHRFSCLHGPSATAFGLIQAKSFPIGPLAARRIDSACASSSSG